MFAPNVRIERPVSLAVLVAAAGAAFVWAQAALWSMAHPVGAEAVLIVRERDALAQALADAPFTGPEEEQGETETLWFVGLVGCEGCDAETAATLRALSAAGLEPAVMFAPDAYPAAPEAAALVAVVARTGNADHFLAWREGRPLPQLIEDPAEAEGYGELARQSVVRLAAVLDANNAEPDLPLLVWRRDGAWRAIPAARPEAAAVVQRDLRS